MKHSWILTRLLAEVPGALLTVSLIVAGSARAQAPVDDSKTVVKSNKITDDFYTGLTAVAARSACWWAASGDVHGGHAIRSASPTGSWRKSRKFRLTPFALWSTRTCIPITPAATQTWEKLGATIFARDELRDRLMNPNPAQTAAGDARTGGRSSGRDFMKTKSRFT